MSTPYPSSLKVGVLLFSEGTQFLDVSGIDMLGMLEKSYLEVAHIPDALVAKGFDIEYHFINEEGKGPNKMTGGFKVEVTDSITTCPSLDILLIGGPPPSHRPSPALQQFLQERQKNVRAFMSVCTGFIPVLFSGILENKTATAPRKLLGPLREQSPGVKWAEKRWARDGNVWTSGAVLNGQEMMAAFMREELGKEEGRGEIVETVLGMCDVAVRGEEY